MKVSSELKFEDEVTERYLSKRKVTRKGRQRLSTVLEGEKSWMSTQPKPDVYISSSEVWKTKQQEWERTGEGGGKKLA